MRATTEEFYAEVRRIDWTQHLGPQATLACDFSGQHPQITHTHFGALKLKDAICDGLRAWAGFRPDVQRERPEVRVHAHANGAQVTVSIDLSGESLHRRGYRGEAGEAPLKENVAAGILLRAGWPQLAAEGAGFLDPMCGSGTLVIEAALIAAHRAPGLGREYFGFLGWRGHDPQLWARVRAAAQAQVREPAAGHHRRCAVSIGMRRAFGPRSAMPSAPVSRRGCILRAGFWRRPSRCPERAWGFWPPIRRMACAWRTLPVRGWRTASWASCCASTSRAGMPRSSPVRRSWGWSWASARAAPTPCGTAPSSAACCA